MPKLRVAPDLEMFYLMDDFTDPWTKPETVLMLHGLCESTASWYAWVPTLARQFKVVRTDMRGFGQSTPMPEDYPWSMDTVVDDFVALMDKLGIERFHLIAAKIGGNVARRFAARHPKRVIAGFVRRFISRGCQRCGEMRARNAGIHKITFSQMTALPRERLHVESRSHR